jgi:hypothetical protein
MDRVVMVLIVVCLFALIDGGMRLYNHEMIVYDYVKEISFFAIALSLFEIWRVL